MEDVAARQAELGLEVDRRARLDARPPVGVTPRAVEDRLGEDAVQRGQRRPKRPRARALGVGREEPRREVQREAGQGLRARGLQLGPEDRRIGQRVAVDLAWHRVGQRPAGGPRVRGVKLRIALVDVEGAEEGVRGIDGGVAQSREPREQQVDLELCALRRRRTIRLQAAQAIERRRRDVGQNVLAHRDALAAARVAPAHRHAVGGGLDRDDLGAAAQLGAGAARGRLQRAGHRAHPAHRHVPIAGAVADHVVEEAAVLAQVGVVRAGEGPDERVGQGDAAQHVVGKALLDELADRALEQRVPRRVVAHAGAQALGAEQRLGHRGEDRLRDPRADPVEALPAIDRRRIARRGRQRRAGALAILAVDEHAARRIARQRRVGGDPPPAQPDAEAQFVDDPLRQQADQVGVARQPRVDTRPRALGDRRAADVVAALEHQHRAPGAREVRRGDQAVVAAADDDRIVLGVRAHQSANKCR